MTVAKRTAVLLRLEPELLARVDAARGALPRSRWLVNLLESHLAELEERDRQRDVAVPRSHFLTGAVRVPARATEVSHSERAPRESGPAGEPFGDTADLGGLEGPDVGSPTHLPEDSRPEQGLADPVAGVDAGAAALEESVGLGAGSLSFDEGVL